MSDRLNSQDAVPVSDPDDSSLSFVTNVGGESADLSEDFTTKEIQMPVFGASVQIFNSGRFGVGYPAILKSIETATTIGAICFSDELMANMFAKTTKEHNHPYDVFAKAKADFGPEAK
ncbi:hypothetical protein [Microvirga sp. BSC39]|uniref:hypothetical protein n=1 Tax=Microvirga sp. BSC39 TaxID=1549810 RepID=UPI0004E91127|nr:hypothetical protein [Microvirga sp. BSC39]KFG70949.1 hypothetical protein JH26_01185 [Microvirga sp. BSC39]